MKLRIRYFKTLASTNTLALQYAANGAPEGLVLVADYQSRGRGKPGRRWVSPAGKNLLFSLLIRPSIPPSRAPILTQIACRAVAKTLRRNYDIASAFKRPNDVMVRGKKICGVLVEASSRANGRLESAVIGIGLNVNARAEQLVSNAISMRDVTGKNYHRNKILRKLLDQLQKDLRALYATSA